MSYMYKRGPPEFKGLVLPYVLDCLPFDVHQEVVFQRGLYSSTVASSRRSE